MVYNSMPIYSYLCPSCGPFEHHSSIQGYKESIKCETCGKISSRLLLADASTVIGIGDASPKTVGAIADRNADKLSVDEKVALYKKNNAYKEGPDKALPDGMTRIEKPSERTRWTE